MIHAQYPAVNQYKFKTSLAYIEGQNTQCYNERRVHGGRGQVVRRQVVALEIVGSSPIAHPSAPVAQRNRALVFGTRGRGFESYRACQRIQNPERASYAITKA